MTHAKTEIFIDDSLNLNLLSFQANGREMAPITVALGTFFNNPNGAPEQVLGKVLLGHLQRLNPDKFQSLIEKKISFEDDFNEDYGIALRLIEISLAEKIKIFVPAIDYMLNQVAANDEEAKIFLNDTWPGLRRHFESFE